MATVKMRKGNKYADIFDSPEMIAGAEADGYELVKEEKKSDKVVTTDAEETPVKQASKKTARQ